MRELESSLQQFGEFLLKAQLVRPAAAPYFVRWVRRFLSRPASDEPLADQVRGFCEELEKNGGAEDWQVRQADQALRIYFVNFLKRTEWYRRPASTVVDEEGSTSPLAALDLLRTRLRTRHYSYRTECTYVDWARRFLDYAAKQQGVPQPRVAPEGVRDYLAHLAVHQHVSASTQNQAFCAILFLCREVLGVNVEALSPGVRAKRGERLPVVLSMPETMGLLGAMSGTPRLMAALIYGGGLRVTECCELRIKDLDFDQGLVVVRPPRPAHTARGSHDAGVAIVVSIRLPAPAKAPAETLTVFGTSTMRMASCVIAGLGSPRTVSVRNTLKHVVTRRQMAGAGSDKAHSGDLGREFRNHLHLHRDGHDLALDPPSVRNLHILKPRRRPTKADAPLVVDPDTVLALPIAFERFQMIARW